MRSKGVSLLAHLVLLLAIAFQVVSGIVVLARPELRGPGEDRWIAFLTRPLPLLALGVLLEDLRGGEGGWPGRLFGRSGGVREGSSGERTSYRTLVAGALIGWGVMGAAVGWLDLEIDRTGYDVQGPATLAGISELERILHGFFTSYAVTTLIAALLFALVFAVVCRLLHAAGGLRLAASPWLHLEAAAIPFLWWVHSPERLPDRLSSWNPARLSGPQSLLVAAGFLLTVGLLPALVLRRRLVAAAGLAALLVAGGVGLHAGAARESAGRARSSESARLRVLLITIDTLRADHLGAYGYSRDCSPRIDRLAREGTLFERAYCSMPTTDPSHVSILTGTYPRRHGLVKNGLRIVEPDAIPHLASWFAGRGCVTGAITSRLKLDPVDIGLRGFAYTSVPRLLLSGADAAGTLERARAFLERYGKGSYFLWVHLWDPHWRYDPPPPWSTLFVGPGSGAPVERPPREENLFLPPERRYTVPQKNWLIGEYDGEIRYADDAAGRIVDEAVRQARRGGRPIVAITADHGETLDELQDRNGYVFGHGELLHEPQLRVPLLLWSPGLVPGGRRIDEIVETIDLAPTLADLAVRAERRPSGGSGGATRPGGVALVADSKGGTLEPKSDHPTWAPEFRCDGTSLAPYLDPERARGSPPVPGTGAAFIERRHFAGHPVADLNVPERSVVEGRYRLHWNQRTGYRLYDVEGDPAEMLDLASEKPSIVEAMKARLSTWEAQHPATPIPTFEIPEDKRRILGSLGYLH